ncbi:hypothetical protein BY458DRAFT_495534 [Sporodiniella umbellata]|nr:hypothetical protein BY458DRAFT_495534 [Sporodiniella umbellata]
MTRFPLSKALSTTRFSRRSIWTGVTATGPSVEECVLAAKNGLPEHPDICVALISKSFSPRLYQNFLKQIQEQIGPKVLMGGVVDRVPEVGHGVSFWAGAEEDIIPFRVKDSQDRLKVRSTSVGRWGRVEETSRIKHQNEHVDRVGWDRFGSISTPLRPYELPDNLDPHKAPAFMFMVSDNEPDELLQTLDHHYPNTPKMGIVGASTPFVTGTPYTLFTDRLFESGIVGFASFNPVPSKEIKIQHTSLQSIGEPMKITRCRGNVILDLDQSGATGLLLKLIHKDRKPSKDEEFYLAVYPDGAEGQEDKMTVSRITSGDPSKGNMSIDTTLDLHNGQTVQFLRKKVHDASLSAFVPANDHEVILSVGDKEHTIDMSPIQVPEKATIVRDTFGGMSENGIIVGRSSLATQLLDVPYSQLQFKTS